ncbi:uncharacterized protein LOC124689036 [Lolium rigidum]|uniref:uncharacterized protein LOC124689036 n=1 Tax=Lolium rigidum TaxID=89674 RepID=UPI001F5CBBE2|nr:uncharacterized protein LOC124689036 [Lolium rigidum]
MDFPLDPVSSLPVYDASPAEAALGSLQGRDCVSSNAGPAAAGVTVLGDLVEGTSVGDLASGLDGADGPVPADSAESTGQGNPQSPGWTKRSVSGVHHQIKLSGKAHWRNRSDVS